MIALQLENFRQQRAAQRRARLSALVTKAAGGMLLTTAEVEELDLIAAHPAVNLDPQRLEKIAQAVAAYLPKRDELHAARAKLDADIAAAEAPLAEFNAKVREEERKISKRWLPQREHADANMRQSAFTNQVEEEGALMRRTDAERTKLTKAVDDAMRPKALLTDMERELQRLRDVFDQAVDIPRSQ